MELSQLTACQKDFFSSGKTLPLSFRRGALTALERAVRAAESELCAALRQDLGKSAFESHMCEVGLALDEIAYLRRHLGRWAAPRRAPR